MWDNIWVIWSKQSSLHLVFPYFSHMWVYTLRASTFCIRPLYRTEPSVAVSNDIYWKREILNLLHTTRLVHLMLGVIRGRQKFAGLTALLAVESTGIRGCITYMSLFIHVQSLSQCVWFNTHGKAWILRFRFLPHCSGMKQLSGTSQHKPVDRSCVISFISFH